MITNNPSQLKVFLNNLHLNVLAFETGFAVRQARKITAESLLIGFFQMMFCGEFSFRLWANQVSRLNNVLISFQAIAKRLDFRQEPFFHALFQKALLSKLQQSIHFPIHDILKPFRRVILEDSTCFKMPKSLFEFFPGARLPHGRIACGRLQLRIDLKSYNYESIALRSYCQNDQSFADDILRTLHKGDLIIRDLGYWSIPVFAQIINQGAYFLSRFKLGTSVLCPSTLHRMNLVSFLKNQDRQGIHQIDMSILLSEKYRIPVRLVAIKLTDVQAAKRRRMAKVQRHKNSKISAKARYLMTWNLLITNVEKETWDMRSVYHAYTLRWHIETMFKCWKSKFNFTAFFKNCHGRNPIKPEIILLLILSGFVLFYMRQFNHCSNIIWKRYNRILSPLRFADYLMANHETFYRKIPDRMLQAIAYYCCYDKRKDRLNHFEKTYMNFLS